MRKSGLPTHPSQSVLRSLRGRGLAFGTVGPQSSCGAFVAGLIRGTQPAPARSKQTCEPAKILNRTTSDYQTCFFLNFGQTLSNMFRQKARVRPKYNNIKRRGQAFQLRLGLFIAPKCVKTFSYYEYMPRLY